MARVITPKQKKFVHEYIATGNGEKSALKAYNTTKPESARAIASETLTKVNVIEYLKSQAPKIAENITRLALQAESEGVQLAAGKDVLDRAGHIAVTKTINVNVEVDATDEIKLAAEQLNALYNGTSVAGDGTVPDALDNKTQD